MILGYDEPALSAKGHLIPPLAGKPVNTYGWALSVNLGQYDLDRSVVSPENMRYFASAVYLSDWHWASGAAKDEPEKDDFDPVGMHCYGQFRKLTIDRSRPIRRPSGKMSTGLAVVLMARAAILSISSSRLTTRQLIRVETSCMREARGGKAFSEHRLDCFASKAGGTMARHVVRACI